MNFINKYKSVVKSLRCNYCNKKNNCNKKCIEIKGTTDEKLSKLEKLGIENETYKKYFKEVKYTNSEFILLKDNTIIPIDILAYVK